MMRNSVLSLFAALIALAGIGMSQAFAQVPPPMVDCGDVEQPEFHSLRPYQASPCDTSLSELDLYCGNDFITKDTIEVSYEDADGACVEISDDPPTYDCPFSEQRTIPVAIGLDDAELPIAGNTQLVPNQVNEGNPQPEQFRYNRRVNEYLSWYFNGAIYRADEELIDPDEVDTAYGLKHVITYAGPLRKLLPLTVQWQYRSDQIGAARRDLRHDQIYVCTVGDGQVPCRFNGATGSYQYDSDGDGDLDTNVDEVSRLTSGTPESPYVPFSSTEDRMGQVFVSAEQTPQPPSANVTLEDWNITFEGEGLKDEDRLYFAHMDETTKLSQILQNTYVPQGVSTAQFVPHEDPIVYNTYRCDLEDVRWNTGDDLFGEIENSEAGDASGSIKGELTYNASFRCQVTPGGINEQCYAQCYASAPEEHPCDENNPPPFGYPTCEHYWIGLCEGECAVEGQTCSRIAYSAFSVYTRTPKAEELWNRTVIGNMSIFKRIFPKLGVNGMFDELKDYPAVTTANYQAEGEGVEALAGKPENNRSGARAEIFLPHLGGIYEFFLVNMQDALRPQTMGSDYVPGAGEPPGGAQCSPAGIGECANPLIAEKFGEAAGTARYICNRESTGSPNAVNNNCLTNQSTYDFSIGLFQINLLAGRCPGAFSVLDPDNNRCEVVSDGTDCSDLTKKMEGQPCNATLRACMEFYLSAENNINSAAAIYSGNWCPWKSNPPDQCVPLPPGGCQ